MPKAYSWDMRKRVIAEVENGASRREAAEEFEVSASTAIIWVKCFRETGRCAAKPRGGSISRRSILEAILRRSVIGRKRQKI
jgi:transposase